jgi:hypothetical protein
MNALLKTVLAAARRALLGISPDEIRYTFEDVRGEIRSMRSELKGEIAEIRRELAVRAARGEDRPKGPEIPVAEA